MKLEFGSSDIKTFSYTLNGIFVFCFLGNTNLHSQVAGGAIKNNNNPKTKIVEQENENSCLLTFVSQPVTVGLALVSMGTGLLAWTLRMFCRTLIHSSRMLGESAVRQKVFFSVIN